MRKLDYKKWTIAFLLLIIVVLAGILFNILSPQLNPSMDNDMMLKTFEVPKGKSAPTLSFEIKKELDANEWDIHITTTNFIYRPDKVGSPAVMGEGHVHLFVDGKLYVVLAPWFHIDALSKGKHTILIRLANNDHTTYAVNGRYIQQEQTLETQ